jgi:hypothetical protein
MSVVGERLSPDTSRERARGRLLLAAVGGVALWAVLMLASWVLWHRTFGFPAGEAWAMAVGTFAPIGMLVVVMVAVIMAVRHEQ